MQTPLSMLLVLMLLGAMLPLHAQTTTLHVRDGKVYINGAEVAAERLPESLDVTGLQANFNFTGEAKSVLEVNGVFYLIGEDGLEEIEAWQGEDGVVSVYFNDGTEAVTNMLVPRMNRLYDGAGLAYYTFSNNEPFQVVRQQYLEELNDRVQSLQELSASFGVQRFQEQAQLMQQVRQEAEQAARVAGNLPLIEVHSYLQDVQQRDRMLYDELLRERTMEVETYRLSKQIRTMEKNSERTRLLENLREKLNTIFDLKQLNRRREVEQLESRLQELQSRVQEREEMRARIIQRRLKELIGSLDR